MTKIFALLAGLALLGACDQMNHGADGYAFGAPEFVRDEFAVVIVRHQSVEDLRRAVPKGHQGPERDIMAWAHVGADKPTCEIHIVDPRKTYAPEWMGHELAHCWGGRWHQ